MKSVNFLIYAISSFTLAGCAMTYQEQRAAARTDTSETLCAVQYLKPQYAQAARDELASRGATCDPATTSLRIQAYQGNQAAAMQQLQMGLQMMQNSQPRPATPPPSPQFPTNCRSVYVGSGITNTTCN